MTSEQMSA